jgi:nitrogen fixation protein NifU and related proteins
MFSEQVLDHFRQPRNAGELPRATHSVEVSNPVCGDVLKLAVCIEAGKIVQARFLCRGCTTAIAAASLVTEKLEKDGLEAADKLNAETISVALGDLPPATFHGAQLAESALSALLAKIST